MASNDEKVVQNKTNALRTVRYTAYCHNFWILEKWTSPAFRHCWESVQNMKCPNHACMSFEKKEEMWFVTAIVYWILLFMHKLELNARNEAVQSLCLHSFSAASKGPPSAGSHKRHLSRNLILKQQRNKELHRLKAESIKLWVQLLCTLFFFPTRGTL